MATNRERLGINLEWQRFCAQRYKGSGSVWYAFVVTTSQADYELCVKRAKEGEIVAYTMLQEYAKWRLTQ